MYLWAVDIWKANQLDVEKNGIWQDFLPGSAGVPEEWNIITNKQQQIRKLDTNMKARKSQEKNYNKIDILYEVDVSFWFVFCFLTTEEHVTISPLFLMSLGLEGQVNRKRETEC